MKVAWKTVLLAVISIYCAMTEAFPATSTLKRKGRGRPNLVDSINNLSWNLITKMSIDQPKSNILVSPVSISSVLLMLWSGAAGKTKYELESVCGFRQGSLLDFHSMQSSIADSNSETGDNKTMILSNAIFFDKGVILKQNFMTGVNEYFNAEMEAVDFKQKSMEATATINRWVRNKTLGVIEEIISGELGPQTKIIITNAVYFKGTWMFPFKPAATSDKSFKTSGGKNVVVPMMRRQGEFAYRKMCRLPAYKSSFMKCSILAQPDVVEIPYQNGKHVMIILIPNDYYSLKRIEEELTHSYRPWRNSIVQGDWVELSIPKFQVKFESSLNNVLEQAGIKTAFNDLANFDDMTKSNVAISKFLHKTAVQIDEGGTTAAAASAAIALLKLNDVKSIIVDRSFYFVIEDVETRVHLFAGKVEDPTEQITVLKA